MRPASRVTYVCTLHELSEGVLIKLPQRRRRTTSTQAKALDRIAACTSRFPTTPKLTVHDPVRTEA